MYNVVTNVFVVDGRDGYFTFLEIGNYVDTYYEYGQSFVNIVKNEKVVEELPLADSSTQSITLLDGSVYVVPNEDKGSTSTEAPKGTKAPCPTDDNIAADSAPLFNMFVPLVFSVVGLMF